MGVTKREWGLSGETELNKWVFRCFLKDLTDGLFLILKEKDFQRTRTL